MTDHKNIYEAMLAVQRKVSKVQKDSQNPHFKNTYASLQAVQDTLYPVMHEEGLVATFVTVPDREGADVLALEIHLTGLEKADGIVSSIKLPIDPNPQKVGSAITYYRRFLLMAAFGLAPTDDDGEAAAAPSERSGATRARQATTPPPRPLTGDIITQIEQAGTEEELKAFHATVIVRHQWPKTDAVTISNALHAKRHQLGIQP